MLFRSQQPKEKVIGVINDLLNTNMFHKEIAEKWNISTEMVQGINTGRYWKHNADYPLQKSKEKQISYCFKCGKEIIKGAKLCWDCYKKEVYNSIINKPDKNTLFQELYDCNGNFTIIGKKYGVNDNSIRKWCIKYGIPHHSSDYKENIVKEKIRDFKVSVKQKDKETENIINVFESISDACRHLGIDIKCGSHISAVCNGSRKTAYGYKWEKINEDT